MYVYVWCVYMFQCMRVRVWGDHAHGLWSPKAVVWSPLLLPTICFEAGSLMNLELANLASQVASGSLVSSTFSRLGLWVGLHAHLSFIKVLHDYMASVLYTPPSLQP